MSSEIDSAHSRFSRCINCSLNVINAICKYLPARSCRHPDGLATASPFYFAQLLEAAIVERKDCRLHICECVTEARHTKGRGGEPMYHDDDGPRFSRSPPKTIEPHLFWRDDIHMKTGPHGPTFNPPHSPVNARTA